MIMDYMLAESVNTGLISSVEPTNEGFDFRCGGFELVTELAEQTSHNLSLMALCDEALTCKKLSESTISAEEAYVLQEASIKEIFNKIKEVIKKMWKRMTEVMGTVITYFTKLVNDKKFIERAKKALANFNGEVKTQGYEFTINTIDPSKAYDAMIASVEKNFKSVTSKAELDKATSSDAVDKYIGAGFNGLNTGNFESELFKKLRNGADSESEIKFDKAKCMSAVEDYKVALSVVKSTKTKVDATYSKALKAVDIIAKENDKVETVDDKANAQKALTSNVCKQQADMLKNLLSYTNKAVSAQISALKAERSQAKSLIMQAVVVAGKKPVATSESTILGSGSLIDSVSIL